jgi:hypothetical protein
MRRQGLKAWPGVDEMKAKNIIWPLGIIHFSFDVLAIVFFALIFRFLLPQL